MILCKAEAIFASSISNFGKFFSETYREDFNSPNESTNSTSLIHNVVSDGKSEQVVTWFLNLIFQHKNECGVGDLSNCSSDICCLCCPTIEFCGISTRNNELMVHDLLANVGIGILPLFCSPSLAKEVLFQLLVELILSLLVFCVGHHNSLRMIPWRTKGRKLLTKNVFP